MRTCLEVPDEILVAVRPESKAPTMQLAPSLIAFSACVRAVSALDSTSTCTSSTAYPRSARTLGAAKAPRWQLWPACAKKPDRGRRTAIFSTFAWARTTEGAMTRPAAPATKLRRSMLRRELDATAFSPEPMRGIVLTWMALSRPEISVFRARQTALWASLPVYRINPSDGFRPFDRLDVEIDCRRLAITAH